MASKFNKPSKFNKRSTAEQVTEGIDLTGKTVLITGVNSGIGTETMRVMALRGAHVIGTARSLEKASDAAADMPGAVTPMACELTDLEDVRRCAAAVAAAAPEIDILIANAGIMALPKLEQVNGIEKQFATNHLGHFLLVNLLREQIKAAGNARSWWSAAPPTCRRPRKAFSSTTCRASTATARFGPTASRSSPTCCLPTV